MPTGPKARHKDARVKRLVIVESPAKANTIAKILGKDYVIKASMGHVCDLPSKSLAVDIEKDFTPVYEVISGKKKVLSELKSAAKDAGEVLLAADPDREGEAICWHLAQELRTTKKPIQRITFNEITSDAVRAAVAHPRAIDQSLVDAQQARRVLDRLVGYQISPLLWRNVRRGLSAGRVQSVAVRLVCDREDEIRRFVPEEYWTITANVEGDAKTPFDARLYRIGDEKATFGTYGFGIVEERANEIVRDAKREPFFVESVTKRERKQTPAPPFTTSTLQQEASRRLGMTANRTMRVAQDLYEGIEVAAETVGLITYMRTDSMRVSEEALHAVREYIEATSGKDYLPRQARRFKTKKDAQDAHEAIRPTDVRRTPESVSRFLSPEQSKLYDLIWKRFVASQMANAVLDQTTVEIVAGRFRFRATGSVVKFPGFRVLYMETQEDPTNRDANNGDDDDRQTLPLLREGERLKLRKLTPKQSFTEPPPRYTEASLVKTLEELGIGRPSTYASIISTIQDREYVVKERGRFRPTDTGDIVTRMLIRSFPDILDARFTARMETELDEVEEGTRNWVALLREFYGPFQTALNEAPDKMFAVKKSVEEVTDVTCELCGRPMAIKWGRYGKFLGCTGYPTCKNTQPLNGAPKKAEPLDTRVQCPDCRKGTLLQRQSRRGKVFYGCSNYPDCSFVAWDPPVPDAPCPKCNAPFLTLRRTQTRQYLLCYRKECGYRTEPTPPSDEPSLPYLANRATEALPQDA
jgi:DNA topoisomerase-1